MKIYNKIEQLIGKTPLFEVENIEKEYNLLARLIVKIESFNPAGSIKDRTALSMLNDAEQKGLIKKGGTIIEPTSGNTGIALAAIGASRGYNVILTMPDSMSIERRKLLIGYGAKVVLTDGKDGMKGAIEKAKELNKEIENSFIPSQFNNFSNIMAHYNGTGPEIWQDTDGEIDVFISGIGTGGTLSGTAKFLKEKKSQVQIIGIEPKSSPLISEGKAGLHKIQGIGANFIPENFKSEYCDKIISIADEDALLGARLLAKKEGILVGISSGATFYAGLELAQKEENKGKMIVVVLADAGERYLSTELFD